MWGRNSSRKLGTQGRPMTALRTQVNQKTQVSKDSGLVLSPTRVSKRKIQAVHKAMFSLGVTCWRFSICLLSHSIDTKLGSKTNPLKKAPEFSKRIILPQLQLMLIIE